MPHESAQREPPIDDDAAEKRPRKRRCIGVKATPAEQREARDLSLHLEVLQDMPAGGRDECKGMPRPCVRFRCRFNLYLEVNERTGSITLNFPGLEPHELEDTCSLDVADRGPQTLSQLAKKLNVSLERARQTGDEAYASFRSKGGRELAPFIRKKGTQ